MKKSISKEEMASLPLLEIPARIEIIENNKQLDRAIEFLKEEKILGFDTESRPSFKKGEHYEISMLQLAATDVTYLFRLNKVAMNEQLVMILSNPDIIKAGVAIRDDIKGLQRLIPFKEAGFVELVDFAKLLKLEHFGLKALVALLLNRRISKKAKLTNWEAPRLSRSQIHYAASDAWSGFALYNRFMELLPSQAR